MESKHERSVPSDSGRILDSLKNWETVVGSVFAFKEYSPFDSPDEAMVEARSLFLAVREKIILLNDPAFKPSRTYLGELKALKDELNILDSNDPKHQAMMRVSSRLFKDGLKLLDQTISYLEGQVLV